MESGALSTTTIRAPGSASSKVSDDGPNGRFLVVTRNDHRDRCERAAIYTNPRHLSFLFHAAVL